MKSKDELQEIIKNNVSLSEVEQWCWFTTPFSDEWVFIVIDKPFWHNVKLIIFDKPYKKVEGVLHVGKVSEHATLNEAQEKSEFVKNHLQNLYIPRTCLLTYLKDENQTYFIGDVNVYGHIVGRLFNSGVYHKRLTLHPYCAGDYLKPFDVVRIISKKKGWIPFEHVGIYLGNNWICHVPGGRNSEERRRSMAQKITLNNFFDNEEGTVTICRPIVPFKSKEQIIQHIARSIVGEFGKGEYNVFQNNCEHFAHMIVFGVNYSAQGKMSKLFTSSTSETGIRFRREVEACANFLDNIEVNDYNELSRLSNEIRGLTQETIQTDEQQALIQVNTNLSLSHEWCKIQ